MEKQTIIVLGPQGSGKGTQVRLLKEYLAKNDPSRGFAHFEAGAELRVFGSEEGYTQQKVRESLLRGEIQPLFVLAHVIASFFIGAIRTGDEHMIVDGFPRTEEQLEVFESIMRFYERDAVIALWIEVSDDEAVTRLLKRARTDDTEESIRRRLSWAREQVRPTFETFKANARYRIVEINGEQSEEEVQREILSKLGLS